MFTSKMAFLNQYLVEKGYAVVSTFPPNVKFVEILPKLKNVPEIKIWIVERKKKNILSQILQRRFRPSKPFQKSSPK